VVVQLIMDQLEAELAKPLTVMQLKEMVRQRQLAVNELVSKNRRIVELVRTERETSKAETKKQNDEEKKRLEEQFIIQLKEVKKKISRERVFVRRRVRIGQACSQ